MEQIHVLRCVIEDSAVFSLIPLVLVFVDFKKAFDNIIRSNAADPSLLWHPEKIVSGSGLGYAPGYR